MIKMQKILISLLALLMLSLPSYTQDKRTTETKVADLLARLPANDFQFTDKLMGDMLASGRIRTETDLRSDYSGRNR